MNRTITQARFNKEVMACRRLSLVHFRTEWSGACQIINPVYEDLARSYQGIADFFSIDGERERGVAATFGVQEYPTILFFRNGELVDHAVGLIARNALITKIENALTGIRAGNNL